MLRRFALISAAAMVFSLTVIPDDAFARAGSNSSMGSSGSRTYSAPPTTNTAPSTAQPMQRSMTPQTAPRPYAAPQQAPVGSSFFSRSPFMSGLMGGLLGAGIGGMLFGGGMFHGMAGFSGFLGFLLQVFVVALIGWMVWRFFAGRAARSAMPAMASPAMAPAMAGPSGYERQMDSMGPGGGGGGQPQIAITPADFSTFEQVLHGVQGAWSAHDLTAMRRVASPEMVSYFAEQMAEQTSRGVRNVVGDVRLEQGDLADAWAEPGRDYARVAMRFSMIDVTRDAAGRVVDGDPVNRSMATEVWTFLRAPGGSWVLSAIQQAG